MKTHVLLRRFAAYYRPYKPILVFDLFCAALTTACELALPLIVRGIISRATTDPALLSIAYIGRLGALYLGLRLIDTAACYFMDSTGHIMGASIETDMRRQLFAKLHRLPFAWYDDNRVGQIMTRITSDLFEVTEFSHHCPEEYFIAGIKLTFAFAVLISINAPLTLLLFAILPLMVFTASWFSRHMHAAFRSQRQQIGELNAQVEDSLLGVRVVKSFTNEDLECAKFDRGNRRFLDIKRLSYRIMGGFHGTLRLFDGMMYLTVVVAGAWFLGAGRLTAADLTAFLLYIATLLASIRRIIEYTEQFQRGKTGIERFYEIIDEPEQLRDAPDARELREVRGEIRFDKVSFRYTEEGEEVLSAIDLYAAPGDHIALVGPSGSGKTTLCNLIPRFYDVRSGRILIDGADVKDLTLESLRGNIGIVQQDVYLFAGTVRENIAYGRPDATSAEIEKAARMAGADGFIRELPQGYDSDIGERGLKLSGGQKQRLAIARVFLKNPPILILDEATSSLDNESERIVQQSLERLSAGRTTFTIAHRLTTIRKAKTILVLTHNGIEEQGNHAELMRRGGIYAEFYRLYDPDCSIDDTASADPAADRTSVGKSSGAQVASPRSADRI